MQKQVYNDFLFLRGKSVYKYGVSAHMPTFMKILIIKIGYQWVYRYH